MKKIILVIMVLLGATICNAQTQKIKPKPVKPVPGQTPPQAPPKKPTTTASKPLTDSTKFKNKTPKVDSPKHRRRVPDPGSMGIEKEHTKPE